MPALLASLFSILILVCIFSISKLTEFYREKYLYELVAWSANGGGGIPLWAEVSNAQNRLNLSKEYCIIGDNSWEFAKEIIEEYKKDLTKSYFSGILKVIKGKYVPRGHDYFMLMLYIFLSDHQCDHKFAGHDMRDEQLEYKRYGEGWYSPCDSKYTLSEFAIVFHKMHYITYMYCRGNDAVKGFVPEWCEEGLKQILDTNQIEISRR